MTPGDKELINELKEICGSDDSCGQCARDLDVPCLIDIIERQERINEELVECLQGIVSIIRFDTSPVGVDSGVIEQCAAALRKADQARDELKRHLSSSVDYDLVDGIRQLAQIALTSAGNVETLALKLDQAREAALGEAIESCTELLRQGAGQSHYDIPSWMAGIKDAAYRIKAILAKPESKADREELSDADLIAEKASLQETMRAIRSHANTPEVKEFTAWTNMYKPGLNRAFLVGYDSDGTARRWADRDALAVAVPIRIRIVGDKVTVEGGT